MLLNLYYNHSRFLLYYHNWSFVICLTSAAMLIYPTYGNRYSFINWGYYQFACYRIIEVASSSQLLSVPFFWYEWGYALAPILNYASDYVLVAANVIPLIFILFELRWDGIVFDTRYWWVTLCFMGVWLATNMWYTT